MADKKKSKGNAIVWAVLGLLVLSLGGFGIGDFGGGVRSIGAVGDTEIEVNDYSRALQSELRARQAQSGRALSLATPEGQRVAEAVRRQLLSQAALQGETQRLGVSVGDEAVRREVVGTPAFQGPTGGFDRDAYAFTLRQIGLSEAEYEARIRGEVASNLVSAAIVSGIRAHPDHVDALARYLGERRDILWLRLGPEALTEALPAPTEEDLRAEYDANPDAYTDPEKRRITYVALTPEALVSQIDVPEADLRALYDQRADEFNQPERRLVERLVFPDLAAAEAAKAALDAGSTTFEVLVGQRGLALSDIDLGDVTRDDLGAAADAVFALEGPGIAGPVETPLGPALFRVNAVLAASETPFEEVRDQLLDELALDRARRMIGDMRGEIDDLIAGGATLEELDADTDMTLGTIEMAPDTADGIAGYAAFRDAARAVSEDDFPELLELEDGGIFALRLDAIVPPTLLPFEEVRDRVAENWRAAETGRRLMALAEAIRAAREDGQSLADQGYAPEERKGIARETFLDGAPATLVSQAFDLDLGGIAVLQGGNEVHIVEVTAITPEDPASETAVGLRTAIGNNIAQSVAQDVLDLFVSALEAEAGITLNQAAINAVHAQFP